MNANTKWHTVVRGSISRHLAGGGEVQAFVEPITGEANFFEPSFDGSQANAWAQALVTHMTSWAAARRRPAVAFHATSWQPVSKAVEAILDADPSWVKHHETGTADDGFIDRIYWRKEVSA